MLSCKNSHIRRSRPGYKVFPQAISRDASSADAAARDFRERASIRDGKGSISDNLVCLPASQAANNPTTTIEGTNWFAYNVKVTFVTFQQSTVVTLRIAGSDTQVDAPDATASPGDAELDLLPTAG